MLAKVITKDANCNGQAYLVFLKATGSGTTVQVISFFIAPNSFKVSYHANQWVFKLKNCN